MKYAFDTSVFIDAYKHFYAMDIVPLYWDLFSKFIDSNEFYLIDKVWDEIKKGNDDLSKWINNQKRIIIYKTDNNMRLLEKYDYVMKSIGKIEEYNSDAIKKWDNKDIADPWLISVALLEKSTIVTHESRVFGAHRQKSKKVKIPDVAKRLEVKCINLFEFMRKEGIVLQHSNDERR